MRPEAEVPSLPLPEAVAKGLERWQYSALEPEED